MKLPRSFNLMAVIFIMALLTMPMMALAEAAPAAPALIDQSPGIMGFVDSIIIVITMMVFIYGQWSQKVKTGKMSRWAFIKSIIPDVHGYVQKLKKSNSSINKALAFTDKIDDALRVAGELQLSPEEKTVVREHGAGYHSEYKDMRNPKDPLVSSPAGRILLVPGSILPPSGSSEIPGSTMTDEDTKAGESSEIKS